MAQLTHLTGTIVAGDNVEYDECWIVDGRLTFARPDRQPDRTVHGWVLPGLVDVHCHVGLGPEGATSREEAMAHALADRASGVLLIRDAGAPRDTSWLSEHSDMPRLIRAGRHLARPKRYLRNFGRELDDVNELPQAMAEEARRGDGWVKLVADWIDRSLGADADLTPLWPREALMDGIAAAHEAGARVTAHVFSHEAIDDLLDAGIDNIEHGTGMTADHMAEAARRGIPVTPTLLQVARFDDIAAQAGTKFPRYARRMTRLHARRHEQVAQLHDAGVPFLMGSDAGGTISHGSLPAELAEVVRAGVPAGEVVAAASWRARDFLNAQGIAEGAPADVVVYDSDPRHDIAVVSSPTLIMLRGREVSATVERKLPSAAQ